MIELAVILSGIKAVHSLVVDTRSVVEALKGGIGSGAKTEQAKLELTRKLGDLEDRLQQVGVAARAAEAYLEAHENVGVLLSLCVRSEEFMKEREGSLGNPLGADFKANWQLMQLMWNDIRVNGETPQRTVMNRQDWYDVQDRAQIDGNLIEFLRASERGSGQLENRNAGALLTELQTMRRHLENADTAIQDTVYRKILATLKEIAPAGPSPAARG